MQQSTSTPQSTTTPYTGASGQQATNATQVVQSAYACFMRGDIPALLALVADDCDWMVPKIDGVAYSGPRRGRPEIARFFDDLGANQRAREFEPREYIAQGDQVVVLGHFVWDVLSTGRTWEADYAHVFAVRDGKIGRFREYTDTAGAAAAFRTGG